MRNLVVGVLFGLFVGAGAAHAGFLHNATDFYKEERLVQGGYVAGMYDLLEGMDIALTETKFKGDPAAFVELIQKHFACMRERAEEKTLAALTDWAVGSTRTTSTANLHVATAIFLQAWKELLEFVPSARRLLDPGDM